VKDLFIIVLLLAMLGLFFHDKQQTTDLNKAQSDNALLTQQLTDTQNEYNQLLAKTKNVEAFQDAHPSSSPSQFDLKMGHLKDLGPDPLDRPAY